MTNWLSCLTAILSSILVSGARCALTIPTVAGLWNCSSLGVSPCLYSSIGFLNVQPAGISYYASAFLIQKDFFGVGTGPLFLMASGDPSYSYARLGLYEHATLTPARKVNASAVNSVTNYRSMLAVYGSGDFYWGEQSNLFEKGKITKSGSTYTMTISGYTITSAKSYSNLTLQDSSYLYCFGFSTINTYTSQGVKLALSTSAAPSFFYTNSTMYTWAGTLGIGSTAVISVQGGLFLFDLIAAKALQNMTVHPGKEILSMFFDQETNRFHMSSNFYYSMSVRAEDVIAEVWPVDFYGYHSYSNIIRLLNVKRFGLILGLFFTYRNTLQIMKKADHSNLMMIYVYNNIRVGTIVGGSEFFISGTDWNIPVWYLTDTSVVFANNFYLQIDMCDSLIAGVCVQCGTAVQQGLVALPNTSNPSCLPVADIPDGFGFDTISTVFQPCMASNCVDCRHSKNVCMQCASGHYLFNTTACYSVASMPPGYGVYSTYAIKCKPANCATCTISAIACTQCQTGYKLNSGQCVFDSDHLYQGFNSATGTLVSCSDPNCKDCKANYQICVSCRTDTLPVFVKAANGSCVPPYSLPSGYGTTATFTLAACTDTNCKNCSDDNTVCVECKAAPVQYYVVGTACVRSYSLPLGWGANLTGTTNGSLVYPCQESFCSNCSVDYSKCSVCQTGTYLYTSICQLPQDLPTGVGPVPTSSPPVTAACSDLNCDDCKQDYTVCRKCKAGLLPQLFASTAGICVPRTSIVAGFGACAANFSVQPCTSTFCAVCQSDFQVCTQCKATNSPNRYLFGGQCLTSNQLPNGYGPGPTAMVPTSCADTNCLNCSMAYNSCVSCSPLASPPVFKHGNTCVLPASLPDFFGADLDSLQSTFCIDPNCQQCRHDYKVCTKCLNNGSTSYYLFQGGCFTNSSLPDYY